MIRAGYDGSDHCRKQFTEPAANAGYVFSCNAIYFHTRMNPKRKHFIDKILINFVASCAATVIEFM